MEGFREDSTPLSPGTSLHDIFLRNPHLRQPLSLFLTCSVREYDHIARTARAFMLLIDDWSRLQLFPSCRASTTNTNGMS